VSRGAARLDDRRSTANEIAAVAAVFNLIGDASNAIADRVEQTNQTRDRTDTASRGTRRRM
jgi:hypothetical protein